MTKRASRFPKIKLESQPALKRFETITIEGFGIGAKGQKVEFGRNVATGRKCRAVVLTVFEVK